MLMFLACKASKYIEKAKMEKYNEKKKTRLKRKTELNEIKININFEFANICVVM